MGKRKCPLCFVRVSWTQALAYSEEMRCPGCHAALELSRFTRVFAGFGGVLAAFAIADLAPRISPEGLWVTQVVAAIVSFGVTSAVCVLLVGDLVVRTKATT